MGITEIGGKMSDGVDKIREGDKVPDSFKSYTPYEKAGVLKLEGSKKGLCRVKVLENPPQKKMLRDGAKAVVKAAGVVRGGTTLAKHRVTMMTLKNVIQGFSGLERIEEIEVGARRWGYINILFFREVLKDFFSTNKAFKGDVKKQIKKTRDLLEALKASSLDPKSKEYKKEEKDIKDAFRDYIINYSINITENTSSVLFILRALAELSVDGVTKRQVVNFLFLDDLPFFNVISGGLKHIAPFLNGLIPFLGWSALIMSVIGIGSEAVGVWKNDKMRKKIDGILGVTKEHKVGEGYDRDKVKDLLKALSDIHEKNPRELKHCGITDRYIKCLKKGDKKVPKIVEEMESTNIAESEVACFKASIIVDNLRKRLGVQRHFRLTAAAISGISMMILGIALASTTFIPANPVFFGTFFICFGLAGLATIIYRMTALRDPINPARVRWIHEDIKHYDVFEQHVYGQYEIPQKIEELQESEKTHKKRIKELRTKGIQSRRDQVTEQRLDTKLKQIDEEIRYLVNMKGELYPLSYKV
jgi:hypothetical protein